MSTRLTHITSLAAACVLAPAASAQLSIPWYTVDGGGGTSSGGGVTLSGTIGQADAGTLGTASLQCDGGFWSVRVGATTCYANCDGSTGAQVLNVNDFICFQSRFAAGDPYADCDHSGTLNVNDFICFQGQFAAGCP